MAEQQMPHVAEQVLKYLHQFPAESITPIRDLISKEDNYQLFVTLEDLIATHKIDGVLTQNEPLRVELEKVYGPRYDHLTYPDLGAAKREKEKAQRWNLTKESVTKNIDSPSANWRNTVNPFTPRVEEFGEGTTHPPMEPSSYGPTHFVDGKDPYFEAALKRDVTLPERIPPAPSVGGPAPRNPFTGVWRPRAPPDGVKPVFSTEDVRKRFTSEGQKTTPLGKESTGKAAPSEITAGSTMPRVVAMGATTGTIVKTKSDSRALIKNLWEQPVNSPRESNFPHGRGNTLRDLKRREAEKRSAREGQTRVVPQSVTQPDALNPTLATSGPKTTSLPPPEPIIIDSESETLGSQSPESEEEVPDVVLKNAEAEDEAWNNVKYDDNWLVNFLKRAGDAKEADTQMHQYQGWRIHSPKVTLIRIKNFLSDEDIDRTLNWKEKYAEIYQYLRHLMDVYNGEDWGYDLKEATYMLRTHWVFEQHHYGKKELILDFPELLKESERLPPLHSPEIVVQRLPAGKVKPRYLLNRPPASLHDIDYQVPAGIVNKLNVEFRIDEAEIWAKPLESRDISGNRRTQTSPVKDFNMALVEDEAYVKSMKGGTQATAAAFQVDSNFQMTSGELETVKGELHLPDRTLQSFADFRGVKRAALQQCLNHFDNSENRKLLSPWRKLVFPKKKATNEKFHEIAYRPMALAKPPVMKEPIDPFGYTYWYHQLLQNHQRVASKARIEVQATHSTKIATDGQHDGMSLPSNFLGPFQTNSLTESMQVRQMMYKELKTMFDRLERSARRAPRPLIAGVLKHIDLGIVGGTSFDQDVIKALRHDRITETAGNEYRFLNSMELQWLQLLCEGSTNEEGIKPRKIFDAKLAIFISRVLTMLNDRSGSGYLAHYEKTLRAEELSVILNASWTVGKVYFDVDDVLQYCPIMAQYGWIRYIVDEEGGTICRPDCNWHPEDRIYWQISDDADVTNEEDAAGLPRWSDILTYEEAFANVDNNEASRDLRMRMYWRIAYRMGCMLRELGNDVDQDLDALAENHRIRADRGDELHNMISQWKVTVFQHSRDETKTAVSLATVVQGADREHWEVSMEEDIFDKRAWKLVREALIREAHESKNMLWPVRHKFYKDSRDGSTNMVLRRENVWDWAAVWARGPAPQFLGLDRWPLHLQTEELQQKSAASFPQEQDEPEAQEERPEQSLQFSMGPPLHLAQEKQQFIPGLAEFWQGDTPLQQRALERIAMVKFRDVLGTHQPVPKTPMRHLADLFKGRTQPPAEDVIEITPVEPIALPTPKVVPRSVPVASAAEEEDEVETWPGLFDNNTPPAVPEDPTQIPERLVSRRDGGDSTYRTGPIYASSSESSFPSDEDEEVARRAQKLKEKRLRRVARATRDVTRGRQRTRGARPSSSGQELMDIDD